MVCTKCGDVILIGPGGCACTRAARHREEMEASSNLNEGPVRPLVFRISHAPSCRCPALVMWRCISAKETRLMNAKVSGQVTRAVKFSVERQRRSRSMRTVAGDEGWDG